MDSLQEILSVGFIIFSLFLILFVMGILKNNVVDDNINNQFEVLSEQQILNIAKTNVEIVRDLARGFEIIDGPRLVNNEDRKKISSIYPDYEPLYQIVIKKTDMDLYVVMNQTSIIHTIPLSNFK